MVKRVISSWEEEFGDELINVSVAIERIFDPDLVELEDCCTTSGIWKYTKPYIMSSRDFR